VDNIRVSAVIPCYNAGRFISAMIECFLRQTLAAWELIIVDDGSTDDSLTIVRDYQNNDARIKLWRRDRGPKGPQVCRNIGISQCKGAYVVIFDADDLISDTCLEKRVAFMDAHPEIDYATFPAKTFTDGKVLPTYDDGGGVLYGVGDETVDVLSRLLTTKYPFTVWTNMYRREAITEIRYIEIFGGYEDFDFMVSGALSGLVHRFSDSREIDYYYRTGLANNMSSALASDRYCEATIKIFSDKLDRLKQRSDYTRRSTEFRQFLVLHFERIIENGSRKNTEDYIAFCQRYYEASFVYKLRLIALMALYFRRDVSRKLVLYFLTTLLFNKKYSAYMFARTVKHWS
jgi:glycosyltransferase involved in cell wall biosynthesis